LSSYRVIRLGGRGSLGRFAPGEANDPEQWPSFNQPLRIERNWVEPSQYQGRDWLAVVRRLAVGNCGRGKYRVGAILGSPSYRPESADLTKADRAAMHEMTTSLSWVKYLQACIKDRIIACPGM
jgi:hypothetical protein